MGDVLKNPHRRKILELLSTRKVATPKEISGELKIGVPTVYYHLELMKGYVQKTARGALFALVTAIFNLSTGRELPESRF